MPTVKVLQEYRCDFCDNIFRSEYEVAIGGLYPNLHFPSHWILVDFGRKICCEKHSVKFIIDNVDISLSASLSPSLKDSSKVE